MTHEVDPSLAARPGTALAGELARELPGELATVRALVAQASTQGPEQQVAVFDEVHRLLQAVLGGVATRELDPSASRTPRQ